MPRVKMTRADRNPWLAKMHNPTRISNWKTFPSLLAKQENILCNSFFVRQFYSVYVQQLSYASTAIFDNFFLILCQNRFNYWILNYLSIRLLMFAQFWSFWYIIGLTSIKIKSLIDILKWISAVSPIPCATCRCWLEMLLKMNTILFCNVKNILM